MNKQQANNLLQLPLDLSSCPGLHKPAFKQALLRNLGKPSWLSLSDYEYQLLIRHARAEAAKILAPFSP